MTFINTFSFFSEKIRLDFSCESSARQRIHMKLQALFSSKKSRKIKIPLLQFLFGPLRVKLRVNGKGALSGEATLPYSLLKGGNFIKKRNCSGRRKPCLARVDLISEGFLIQGHRSCFHCDTGRKTCWGTLTSYEKQG